MENFLKLGVLLCQPVPAHLIVGVRHTPPPRPLKPCCGNVILKTFESLLNTLHHMIHKDPCVTITWHEFGLVTPEVPLVFTKPSIIHDHSTRYRCHIRHTIICNPDIGISDVVCNHMKLTKVLTLDRWFVAWYPFTPRPTREKLTLWNVTVTPRHDRTLVSGAYNVSKHIFGLKIGYKLDRVTYKHHLHLVYILLCIGESGAPHGCLKLHLIGIHFIILQTLFSTWIYIRHNLGLTRISSTCAGLLTRVYNFSVV